MGNFFKRFMNIIHIDDLDDEYDAEDERESFEYARNERETEKREKKERGRRKTSFIEDDEEEGYKMGSFFDNRKKRTSEEKSSKLVPLKKNVDSETMRFSLFKPLTVKEVNKISDRLSEGFAVVLNLEGIDTNEAQRIMDFISGTVYTQNGQVIVISKYIFLFLPKDAYFDSDVDEALTSMVLDRGGLSSGEFEIPIIKRDF